MLNVVTKGQSHPIFPKRHSHADDVGGAATGDQLIMSLGSNISYTVHIIFRLI